MHYFTSRILTVLSIVVVFSFLASSVALGGLVGGLAGTVEDVLEVDSTDGTESGQVDDGQVVDEETTAATEEPATVTEDDPEPRDERPTQSDDQGEVIQVDDNLLELDGEDKHVRVENELLESVADSAGVGEVGSLAYTVQEDVLHGSVTKLTGKKVDHFYAWVCIGSVCLPVDPITFDR